VNERAKQILAHLEQEHVDESGRPRIAGSSGPSSRKRSGDIQLTLFGPPTHPLIDTLRELELDSLTPLAALQLLQQWQEEVRRGS
jgi:DNA mismatch repair protein MutS